MTDKIPERIYGWQLKKFLQNPFEFQVTEALDLPENEADTTLEAFEPVAIDGLQRHQLSRELFTELVKKGGQAKLNDEDVHALFKDLRAKGDLPDDLFGKAAESQAKKILDVQLESMNACGLDFTKFEAKAQLQYQYGTSTLTAESDWSRKASDGEWLFFNVCSGNARTDHYLNSFICSLAIAAQASQEVRFTLYVIPGAVQKNPLKPKTYSISPEDAKKRLDEIIRLCFEERCRDLVPVEFTVEAETAKRPDDLYDYIYKYWEFPFPAKAYFNDDEFGFVDDSNFQSSALQKRSALRGLLKELINEPKAEKGAKK